MADHREASNKDIARQFDLPERQSKIATLLKQNDVYCICRSTDSTSFMIACDNCEEWYHGDCIGITEQDAKYIKKYFCERCQEENSSLKIAYKSKKPPLQPTNKERRSKDKEKVDKRGKVGRPKKNESKPKSESKHRKERQEEKQIKAIQQTTPVKLPKRRGKRNWVPPSSSSGEDASGDDLEIIQCYGPACTQVARPGSKYCSDTCGINLASTRVYRVLPSRIHEWSLTPSIAEQRNREELEDVRKKQFLCRKELEELETKRKKLDEHIAQVQNLRIDPNDEEMEPEEDGVMSCITCGHEISMKTCIKHMEKCYNKHESQTSFASIAKTNVEGIPIFCDYHNPLNNSYCKRLKVLCPEHSREPKIKDNELCGCPLIRNVFEVTDEICRVAKKKCNRHFCWEKLYRAEIDMERVRQWLKYDELLEAEKTLRQALTNRAGVLGLLLHSSFDYDAAVPGVTQPT
ncbi:unnamed protein product [Allacma fusca]|uniref:CXXC-type zinc finger protein 1 n=1 Tax=Allacma fusca TaxID=39272 RepID=A0A8J2KGL6_9HEXA|nr:unnamed protein product [Allacma fusca]